MLKVVLVLALVASAQAGRLRFTGKDPSVIIFGAEDLNTTCSITHELDDSAPGPAIPLSNPMCNSNGWGTCGAGSLVAENKHSQYITYDLRMANNSYDWTPGVLLEMSGTINKVMGTSTGIGGLDEPILLDSSVDKVADHGYAHVFHFADGYSGPFRVRARFKNKANFRLFLLITQPGDILEVSNLKVTEPTDPTSLLNSSCCIRDSCSASLAARLNDVLEENRALKAQMSHVLGRLGPPMPPPPPLLPTMPAQPELVGFCTDCTHPALSTSPGMVGRTKRSAHLSWGVATYSLRVIRSPADMWNGFSFRCGSTSGYKVLALTSNPPAIDLSHAKYEYGFVCRPGGLVTMLTPNACNSNMGHSNVQDGNAASQADTSDTFAIKFNQEGKLEYRANGDVLAPTCSPLSGVFPQPTKFPLHLIADLYTNELPSIYSLQGITWLSSADA